MTIIVTVKVLGKPNTIKKAGSIIFDNVKVTYQRKTNIVGWKENHKL